MKHLQSSQFTTVLTFALIIALYHFTLGSGQASWAAPQSAPTIPQAITYQGTLANAQGEPINDSLPLTFNLYDVAEGGAALWSETHNSIPIVNGLYTVRLGSITPFSSTLWENGQLYIGVQVDNDSEMTPREPLSAVPWSYYAQKAATAATTAELSTMALYKISYGDNGTNIVTYHGPTGTETSLDLNSCSTGWCCNSSETICYKHGGSNNSILEFYLKEDRSDLSCALLHSEDDFPSYNFGLGLATDSGNQSHLQKPSARISRQGETGPPFKKYVSYYLMCLDVRID